MDRRPARALADAHRPSPRNRRATAGAGRLGGQPHRRRHPNAEAGRRRAGCLPRRQPRHRLRLAETPAGRLQGGTAPVARIPARLHSAEPRRPRRSRRPAPRNRGLAVLPHRRRQDRGVPGSRGNGDGAAPFAPSRSERQGRRGRQRGDALHAAPAHPRSAEPRRRPRLRVGTRTRERRSALRRVAVRDRPVGGQGRHAQRDG